MHAPGKSNKCKEKRLWRNQIADVGIAHRGETEYLKAIPNGSENDNLGNLPSVSPEPKA